MITSGFLLRSVSSARPFKRDGYHSRLILVAFALSALLSFFAPPPLQAAVPAHGSKWVATWSQSLTSNYRRVAIDSRGQAGSGDVVEYKQEPPPVASHLTLRQTVLVSIGGNQVRVRLSNYYGTKPLTVSSAHIARWANGSKNLSVIDPSSDRTLTFHGKPFVTIPPGAVVASDAVSLHVPDLSRVVVSLYFARGTQFSAVHPVEQAATTAVVAGNAVAAPTLAGRRQLTVLGKHAQHHIFLLAGIDVVASESTRGIVAIGDSITDGVYATSLAKPWPEVLATIANSQPHHAPVAVVNAGISADELTTDQIGHPRAGMSGLKRFERNVIDQPGVTDVVVLFGANDINRGIGESGLPTGARAGDIIASLRMLADVAHEHHLRIYVGTITPFAGFPGAGWYTPAKEAVRERVNDWIRHTHLFNGVVPFAKAVKGKYVPSKLASEQSTLPPGMATVCTVGGLHPNDRGYAVMGTVAYDTLFNAHLHPPHPCH